MLTIHDTLKRSWDLVEGSKKPLWMPIIIVALLNIVILILLGLLMIVFFHKGHSYAAALANPILQASLNIITSIVLSVLLAPIIAGILITALKRCRGEVVQTNSAFGFKEHWLQTAAALGLFLILNIFTEMICSHIAVTVIESTHNAALFWTIILSGNIISVLLYSFLLFSLIIIVEQNKKAISALIASAKLVSSHWLSTTMLYIIAFAIIIASTLPLFISTFMNNLWIEIIGALITIGILIWTLPYCILMIAMTYQRLSADVHTEDSERPPHYSQ
ncbi:MAG: hypothetical protein K0U23_01670 [Gammaproteobacteria bacterium]|nr:hypothetical protein [Gammaproteobacteria bacterium]